MDTQCIDKYKTIKTLAGRQKAHQRWNGVVIHLLFCLNTTYVHCWKKNKTNDVLSIYWKIRIVQIFNSHHFNSIFITLISTNLINILSYETVIIQWKPFNVITLVESQTDNNNRMTAGAKSSINLNYSVKSDLGVSPIDQLNINWMLTLSVKTLSRFYYKN